MKLDDIFMTNYEFTLENVAYSRLTPAQPETDIKLTISDTINAKVSDDQLSLSVTRSLRFTPESMFSLSVTFGIILSYRNKRKRDDTDWSAYFAHNQSPYFDNIMPRISALIAQITASYGQQPLVTPPSFIQGEA